MLNQAIIVLLIQTAGTALSLLISILITNNTDTATAGLFFALVNIVFVVSSISQAGQQEVSIKYSSYQLNSRSTPIQTVSLLLVFLVSGILSIATIIAWKLSLMPLPSTLNFILLLAAAFTIIAKAINLTLTEIIRSNQNHTIAALSNNTLTNLILVSLVLIIIFSANSKLEFGSLAALLFASQLISVGIFWAAARRTNKQNKPLTIEAAALFKSSMYFWVISAIYALQSRFDIWLLGYLGKPSSVAIYTVAAQMAIAFSIFSSVSTGLSSPLISGAIAQGKIKTCEAKVRMLSLYSTIPSITMLIVIFIFGEAILAKIFGQAYAQAYWCLVILASAQVVNTAAGPCGLSLNLFGEHALLVLTTFSSLAISVTISIIGYQFFDYTSVAIGFSCGLIFQNLILLAALKAKHNYTTFARIPYDISRRAKPFEC